MKFLIDEALSLRLSALLTAAGHDAVHVADRGLLGAADEVVMAAAAAEGRVLVSADTDFGELLALGRHPGPSLVIFRRASRQANTQLELLAASLPEVSEALLAGAVVIIAPGRLRVRPLPIEGQGP